MKEMSNRKMKKKLSKREQGKRNRASGKRFELKVRTDLEKQGWIVFRNSNDVEFSDELKDCLKELPAGGEIPCKIFKQAKSKWNPFTKMPMTLQSGFPDFICIKLSMEDSGDVLERFFKVMFVECKVNGQLSKIEKEKCKWIENFLFIPVFVAKKGKKRGEINYETPI